MIKKELIMSSIFIKNASSIVTCDNDDRVLNSSNLLIENGVITYIGNEETRMVVDGRIYMA